MIADLGKFEAEVIQGPHVDRKLGDWTGLDTKKLSMQVV